MVTLHELIKVWEEVVSHKVKKIESSLFGETLITLTLFSIPQLWQAAGSLQIEN